MKIAYVVDGRLPTEKANGYQSMQMCQAFAEIGCEVDILVASRRLHGEEREIAGIPLKEYYGLRREMAGEKIPSIDFPYYLERVLGLSGNNPITHAGAVFRSYIAALYLRRRLVRGRQDLIYVRSSHLLTGLVPLLPERIRRRLIFEAHAIPGNRKTSARLLRSLSRIGGTVALTSRLKEMLVQGGLPAGRILVEHDSVDLASFAIDRSKPEARAALGLPADAQIAAYIGKFHTMGNEKGIPEIIRSAKSLLPYFPSLLFYFVGGPLDREAHYRKLISLEGLPQERFVFLEKQPVQRVPLFLKASDLLLMPFPWSDHYAYFMSPLKLFEYMSSDRPLIATHLPSVKEILEDGCNALLCNPGDPVSLAEMISRLLRNPELGERLAGQARRDVGHYTWENRARRILDFVGG